MTEPTVTLDKDQPLKGKARVAKPRASVSEAKRSRRQPKADEVITDQGIGFSDLPERGHRDIRQKAEALLDEVIRPYLPSASLPGNVNLGFGRMTGNIGDEAGSSTSGAGTITKGSARYRVPSIQIIYPTSTKYETGGKVWALLPHSWGSPEQVIQRVLAGVCELVYFNPGTGRVDAKGLADLMINLGFVGTEDTKTPGQRRPPTATTFYPTGRLLTTVRNFLKKHGPIVQEPINLKPKKDDRDRTERGSSTYVWACSVAGCKAGWSETKEQHQARIDILAKGDVAMKITHCQHDPRMMKLTKAPGTLRTETPTQPKASKVKLGLAKDAKGKVAKDQVSEDDAKAAAKEAAASL